MHQSWANFFLINTEKNMKRATLSSENLFLRNRLEQGKGAAKLQFLHAAKGKGHTTCISKTTQSVTNHAQDGANARLRRA